MNVEDFLSDLMINPIEDELDILPIVADEDAEAADSSDYPEELPMVPLRNTVLFPGVVIPITVGRDKSIQAVKAAYKSHKTLALLSQVDHEVYDPEVEDLYKVGTIAQIVKMLKMPDGTTTAIIQGKKRFRVKKFTQEYPYFKVEVDLLPNGKSISSPEFNALIGSMKDMAKEIIKLSPNIPSEASFVLKKISNPVFLTHFIASNLNTDVEKKQEILEMEDFTKRANAVLELMNTELQMLELKNKIQSKVRGDIEKQQRDYFLHQQMKMIQEELGGNSQDKEIERFKSKAKTKKWSKEVQEVFEREIEKLERTNPAAAEYSVSVNYLELLLSLPWSIYSQDHFDLNKAMKVLERDHFGLDKVKERVLEYLAVLKLKGDMKSPILCFVGPPGVGKTSLGKSIAEAINRKYVRMSLGGLHDESEIRGHRKTYIGAMPGRIIQSLKKVKTSNPVFILDEIDKVGSDFRGDPSSALLEVLDPEQNSTFYDNYLELEYDLSNILFIATANSVNTIQPALRDRMEIIQIDGYSIEEKVEIAKKHLLPKQREAHGLKAKNIKIPIKTLNKLVEEYTKESGVRELDRTIASVMRNTAKKVAMEEKYEVSIAPEDLHEILGPVKYDPRIYSEKNPAGVAVGLAYTSVGGDILFIETNLHKGKGGLTLTGNLGDVMKESATTALSYLKSHCEQYNLDPDIFKNLDVHVHVPEGAIPKDGPSAGITMLTAITSSFTQRKVKPYLAMTGEITLRGKVLPVGGIKEKILAAKRAGMKEIVLNIKNKKDVDQINSDYLKGLQFHFVENMSEVLNLALEEKKVRKPLDIEFLAELKK